MVPSEALARTWERVRNPLVQAFPGWLVARVLVVTALVLAHYLADQLHVHDALVRASVHHGLVGWDGAYYVDIAAHGYESIARDSLRFFPLIPLLARPLIWAGIPAHAAVVIVSNISALIAGMLLFILARRETRDTALAVRSTWFFALAPAAFVLVMGYTEATTIALAIGMFLALRCQALVDRRRDRCPRRLEPPVGLPARASRR